MPVKHPAMTQIVTGKNLSLGLISFTGRKSVNVWTWNFAFEILVV